MNSSSPREPASEAEASRDASPDTDQVGFDGVTSPRLPRVPNVQDILLVIFIHGFKGTDTTFNSFPSRLQHILTETINDVKVECIVFPAYETKGDLTEAVERFSDWLAELTVRKEVDYGAGGGAGKAKVVICGHSMGGLLAADSLLAFANSRADKHAPLWPQIIACIAFDTPYYGLHPHIFKNSATKASEYAQTAHKTATSIWSTFGSGATATRSAPAPAPAAGLLPAPSAGTAQGGGWKKWAPTAYALGGALVAGAAVGTAYFHRTELGGGYAAMLDHMRYLGTLWDEPGLDARVEGLLQVERDLPLIFRTFYTFLPPALPAHPNPRTFCLLPKTKSAEVKAHFAGARNALAEDEVQAHIGMFSATTNDGYYELGLQTAGVIRDALAKARGLDSHAGEPGEGDGRDDRSRQGSAEAGEKIVVNEAEMEDLDLL